MFCRLLRKMRNSLMTVVSMVSCAMCATDRPYDAYNCNDGSVSLIWNTLVTHLDALTRCKSFTGGQQVSFGTAHIPFIKQRMCNALQGFGPYWVAPCTTIEGNRLLKDRLNCQVKIAYPVCKVQDQSLVQVDLTLPSTTSVPFSNTSTSSGVTSTLPPSLPPSSTISVVTTSTDDNDGDDWTIIGQSEYLITKHRKSFSSAWIYCYTIWDASLMTFLAPVTYFQIFAELHITSGSYWIQAGTQDFANATKCVAYNGDSQTMSTVPCDDKIFSVCKRSIYQNDTETPLHHPQFVQLIKDMTVEKSETVMNKRKLVSADDQRPYSKTAGSFAVFLLCFMLSIMLILDLARPRS